MSNLGVRDVRLIMVGAGDALSTGGVNGLNTGEVGAFKVDGTRITAANDAGTERFFLAAKLADGTLQRSDVIDVAEITGIRATAGANDQESVDYLGFNGTSGDIAELNNNDYFLSVHLQEYYESHTDGRMIKHARAYTEDTGDKHAVAKELVKDAIRNMGIKSKESEPWLKAELVSAEAGDALGTSVDDVVFTQGSPYFSADDIDDSTGGAALAVGNFLRIGTAVTDPIYEIVEIDAGSNIGKLANPYQGPSATIADTGLEQVTLADFDAAAVGVKLTSWPLSFDAARVGRSRFRKRTYTLAAANFGDTLITNSQSADKGVNAAETVAELEYFQQKFEFGDNKYEIGEPNLFATRSNVDLSEDSYESLTITFKHRKASTGSSSSFNEDMSSKEIQLFTPSSADPTWLDDGSNGLRLVLEQIAGLGSGDLTP